MSDYFLLKLSLLV